MRHFYLCSSDVVSEVIENEAIIMNLRTGHYFSARSSASEVWEMVVAGRSDLEMLAAVCSKYDVSSSVARHDLDVFLSEIIKYRLVYDELSDDITPDAVALSTGKRPYTSITLEVYDDVESLMQLDPIHDVAESVGWPTAIA